MSLLRRFVIRAAQELGHNPEARAKASQVLEEQVRPRAEQAWREAQPKIENAKVGLKKIKSLGLKDDCPLIKNFPEGDYLKGLLYKRI